MKTAQQLLLLFFDVAAVAVSALLVVVLFVLPAYQRRAWLYADEVPLPCRRIAAVYVGMRLYQLEDEYSPYARPEGTPFELLAEYFKYDPDNPVPKKIIPDLRDYDIDEEFLADSQSIEPSRIVIAAKAPDKKSSARLVVLADGTMKAVASTEPLIGKDLSEISVKLYNVTPEQGIVIE